MANGAARFLLRFRNILLDIGERPLVVGRSAECDLVLDDPLVSRKHLRLSVAPEGVVLEDLSSNGAFVAGRRIAKRSILTERSAVTVGNVQVEVLPAEAALSVSAATRTAIAGGDTLSIPVTTRKSVPDDDSPLVHADPTHQTEMLHIMEPAADAFLREGKAAEAEDTLAGRLHESLSAGRSRGKANPAVAPTAARCALKLADATGKQSWVDYVFELYGLAPDPLPIEAVEELYRLAHKGRCPDRTVLKSYLERLDAVAHKLGPSARFALQRLRGLEQLIVWK